MNDYSLVTESDLQALLLKAGVRPDELLIHDELGLCLSASGVAKLAAMAPDQNKSGEFVEWVAMMSQKIGGGLH